MVLSEYEEHPEIKSGLRFALYCVMVLFILAFFMWANQSFADNSGTAAGICSTCSGNSHNTSGNLQMVQTLQQGLSKPICPVREIEAEITNMSRQNGLRVLYGDEVDWGSLRCTTTEETWNSSGISGFYCRQSNTIILRRGDPDVQSTKFHEFQHYKNNSQLPSVDGQHPFDAIDAYFEQIGTNNISKPDLSKALQVVLMILWDETQAFQMDIACSANPDLEINDDFIIHNFHESYVPRFAGLRINREQLATIYWAAKNNPKLADFQKDSKVISILSDLNRQNQRLTKRQ